MIFGVFEHKFFGAATAADFSYVSTAGGAFLEWLEGKTLPGIAALDQQDIDFAT